MPSINIHAVVERILQDRRITDCVVVPWVVGDTRDELVAYFVASAPLDDDALRPGITDLLPEQAPFLRFVQVTNIPFDRGGHVDLEGLSGVAVIDQELAERWEARLALPGIEQVAVVVQPRRDDAQPFHLSELLPAGVDAGDARPAGSALSSLRQHGPLVIANRPLAICDGGPLIVSEDQPRTMTEALLRTASAYPDKGMIYARSDGASTFQSYPDLLTDAQRILSGLRQKGLRRGDRVILQIASLRDHFPAFWACVLGGIIPVTVAVPPEYETRNSVVSKLYNTWKLLEGPTLITNEALADRVRGLGRLLQMPGLQVTTVEELRLHPPSEPDLEVDPSTVLFYQLTSGSTGTPKCIQITHRGVISHIHAAAQFNGYRTEDVTLNWLPLDHVVPILTCHLKDVYLGCQQIEVRTAEVLTDPLQWPRYLDQFRVNVSWAPNFGYKLVADRLREGTDERFELSSVRYLMNAGEQVTLPVVRDFTDLLAPHGLSPQAMQPAFGMAEACTCMTYRNSFSVHDRRHVHRVLHSSLQGELIETREESRASVSFIDLGPPVPGVEIRIADAHNRPVSEGIIGRFQIRGQVITPGYLNNPSANEEAFVGDGWFNTGDLGFIVDGSLSLTGREKEMIIIRGANYYCYEIEEIVNGVEGVEPTFAGAFGIHDPNTGSEGLVICFVPRDTLGLDRAAVIRAIRQQVASNIGIAPLYVIPLLREAFPKTTSGKIQRGRLQKSFLEGEYAATCLEAELALGGQNSLPRWFYRRTWYRQEAAVREEGTITGVLLLADRGALAAGVARILDTLQRPCICVEQGPRFEQIDASRYRIDPGSPGDYRRLIRALSDRSDRISHIVHLWGYDGRAMSESDADARTGAGQSAALSALYLVQALVVEWDAGHKIDLIFASDRSQSVCNGDLVDPGKGALIGLVRTIAHEYPWVGARHLDLGSPPSAASPELLVREMRVAHGRSEVAYREGLRWVSGLEAVDLAAHEKSGGPIRRNGLYVIAGGLGGIGVALYQHLIDEYGAQVVILGRTPFAELSRRNDGSGLPLRAGATYMEVDVTDALSVERAFDAVAHDYGRPPDGVFHLAGIYQDRRLVEETGAEFAAVLRPKLLGAQSLSDALQRHNPRGLFVSFSSIYGYFGASLLGAYAAANRCLEAHTAYLRRKTSLQSYCYAWSNWVEVGMSRGYHSLQASGYQPISVRQGMLSLTAALRVDVPTMLIGLDGSKANISRQCNVAPRASRQLYAYWSGEDLSPDAVAEMDVRDAHGNRSQCVFVRRSGLPVSPSGSVDKTCLVQDMLLGERARSAPSNQTERSLASIWRDLLRVDRVGTRDNFFELGGDSLLLAQLLARIEATFGKNLSTIEVFQYPTIAEMAPHLDGADGEGRYREAALERARARQQRRARREG